MAPSPTTAAVAPPDRPFPARMELPDGFQPEGIALGPGPTAWFGSRADGDIYEVSLRTGEGSVISQGPGTPSVGMKSDRQGRLYVAGGTSGTARVVDTATGEVVRDIPLSSAPTFVNDVVLSRSAAWFTDSNRPQLYRVDRGPDGEPGTAATTLALTGEWVQGTGFGANGISTTPTGRGLLVVNSTTGLLYRVDPATGEATEVDLGGASLTMGDGMLRHGRTLYVVRNRINEVAVLRLSRTGLSGRLVRTITADDLGSDTSFDVPTTVAKFGANLYLPNARFSTPPTPDTDYWVTKVRAKAGS
ncbi:superoxide dismutase [Nocardioides sp. zg-1230]|nr:superoxide dismutase [Nocardioides sp. zg-1230]